VTRDTFEEVAVEGILCLPDEELTAIVDAAFRQSEVEAEAADDATRLAVLINWEASQAVVDAAMRHCVRERGCDCRVYNPAFRMAWDNARV
jgi:hypothetical protein